MNATSTVSPPSDEINHVCHFPRSYLTCLQCDGIVHADLKYQPIQCACGKVLEEPYCSCRRLLYRHDPVVWDA